MRVHGQAAGQRRGADPEAGRVAQLRRRRHHEGPQREPGGGGGAPALRPVLYVAAKLAGAPPPAPSKF